MAVLTKGQIADNLKKRTDEMNVPYYTPQEYHSAYQNGTIQNQTPEKETLRSVMGKLAKLTEKDLERGQKAFLQFQQFQTDSSSPFFNPFTQPTNRSVSALASMGIDTSNMDDNWFNSVGQELRPYYQFNGTTNTPSKPGKKSSPIEQAAYEFYQIEKSRADTANAKSELAALKKEINYWANRTDLNLSDEEIIQKIGLAENSKYKTLAKMDATRLAGTPMELNEAIDYDGVDSLYGMIWAARNNGGTGNSYADMANSYNKVGNVWKYDQKIAERLDPKSDNFAPYMAGTTNMDDAAVYFGVNSFGPNWLADNDGMQWSSDETKAKMYRKVAQGEENWQKANSELEELNKWLTKKLSSAKDPKKVMERIDWDDYPTLSAMNKSTGYTDINGMKTVGTGNLLAMTRGIDYSYKSILDRVVSACEKNSAKVGGDDTVDGFTPPSDTATTTVPSTDTATAPATQTEETPEQPKSFWQSAGDTLHMMGQGIGNFLGWTPVNGTEEEPTAEPEPSHPVDALPPAPSPEETSGAVDAKTAPKVATAGPTPTPPPATTPGPMTTPAPRKTTGTQHTEAVLNEKVEDGASALDTSMTLAEQRFFQNVPGVEYDRIRDRMIQGPLNPALWQDENFKGYNLRKSESKRNQEYTDTLIGNAGTIKEHDDLQKNIEEIEGTLNKYEEKYGDQIYAGTEVPEEIEFKLSNGASFAIYLNPDTGLYESPLLNGGGLETLETYAFRMGFEATDAVAEEIQTHIDRANSFAQTVSNANEKYGAERQEGVPTLDEVNALYDRLDNYRSQLDEGLEAYNEAVDSNAKAKNRKNIMDEMLLKNGFDVQDAANFEVIADSIVNIGSWQEPDPLPLSLSTQLMESYAIGKTDIVNADEQIKEIDENIADAKYLLQFAGGSQEYTDGINSYINYMQGQRRQFEYFKLSTDEHFGDWVKAGQNQIMSGSANVGPLYNTMSYDEQEMFMALLGRYGQDAADKYFQDIEQTLVARTQYVIDTNATEIAESGVAGRVLNLVEGIGIAPLDVLTSAADLIHTAVTGEGNDWLGTAGYLSKSAYAADQRAVEEKYKDNPALKTIVSGIYEILYNRGRSAMVAATFGGLFPEGTSEVFQAMPIALTAADETLQKYLDAGVEPWKAGALATVAFLSESLTEGIELKNIKSAFSLGEDISRSALATFFGNYIPDALPEIVGESVNDIAEKMADYWLAGDRGDLRGLMQSYLDQGLAANEDEAYEMMMRDQIADVAHTALISLFSHAADLGAVGLGEISSYSYYAQKARNISNLTGQKVTVRELRNGDIATIKAANRAAEEADLREPGAFNFGDQRPAIPRVTLEGQENTNQYELEITILDGIADSDATTQAATVAAVMENAGGDRNRADAVAAHIGDVFDDAINTVQQIMAGGMSADVNINMLKSGFAQAVLGNGKARALVISESFRNAAPDTQARWLAEVGAEDAANPDVQNQVANAVHENRVANEEKRLLANGAAKPAQDAAAKALASAKMNEQAKDDLESRQNDLEAKGQNLEAAQSEFQQDPGNPAKADQVTHAIGEVTKANEVAQEYEQHSRNAQETADKDKAEAKRVADETMADIRSQAEASVAQQEQAEAEAAAAAQAEAEAEQQRLEEEAREQTVARAGENSANHADREAFVSRWMEDHPNATQEDLQHIRDVWDQAHKEAVMASPILQPLLDKEGKFTEKGLKARDKIVKHLGEKFNVGISYASDDPNAENYDPALIGNGYYNKDTRQIVLNQDVSMSDAVYVFLGHELTHVAEDAGTYTQMADSLLRLAYGKDAQSYQEAIDNLKKNGGKATTQMEADLIEGYYNRYKRNLGNKVDYEYAMQEMVADYMGTLIKPNSESERMDMIDRLVADDPSLARRIMDTIKNFIKKVAGIEDSWLDDARHTVDLFEKSLSAVRENQETIQSEEEQEAQPITDANGNETDAVELRGGTVAAVPENVRHSLRTWTEDEKTRVRKALIKTGRFATSDIDDWINSVNGVAATIAADKTRLDFEASDVQTMLKPNQEYKFTVDASTLCAKRLLYQGTFNAIQHLLPNTILTSEDLIDLSNLMREMGYETPCGICYVESRRRHLDKFAGEWLEKYEGAYKPTLADVTTTDGLEGLRLSDDKAKNQAYEDFVAAMNGKGVANPKVVELRTEYRGEIAKLHPMTVRNLINHGGLRLQSFSDFETPHLLDMIQVVMDLAGKGLTSQAYTKVPNFAWAFGDTGVKINLSLIGKGTGVDENGNLLFDDVEGMPFEEAMKLRDRYSKNVGTILVGINDDHIIAAMADNRIDYIIPFHKSGWSKTELERMPVLNGYSDYTNSQNEKKIKARKADGSGYDVYSADDYKMKNFEPVGQKKANGNGTDGYWDFTKTGRENAETYLKMCADDGRVPKFSQFLVDNGDGTFSLPQGDDARSTAIREGYWKTLIDFKMYDNDGAGSPQTAVTPNVNMAQAQRILDEYSLDRNGVTRANNNDLPVANPVVERFVDEYNAKHQASESNIKHSLPVLEQEYEQATAEGNQDWQAQVVQQAAHAAGYTTGAYHGSNETEIDEFNTRSEDTKKQKLQLLFGTHFTQNRQYAEIYAKKAKNSKGTSRLTSKSGRIYDVYLDLGKSLDLQTAKNYTPDTEMFQLYNDLPQSIKKKHKPLTFSAYDTEQGIGSGDFVNARIIEEALQDMSPKDATEFLVSHGYNSVLYNANYNMGMANNAFGRDPSIIMLDPERIKSAEPETYDDNGNLIPLSERFNRQKNSIRYSLPSDAPYMAAVERGEMDAAQRMVDEKAREAGYTDVAYHGTQNFGFTEFNMGKSQNSIFVSFGDEEIARTYTRSADVKSLSEKAKTVWDLNDEELFEFASRFYKRFTDGDGNKYRVKVFLPDENGNFPVALVPEAFGEERQNVTLDRTDLMAAVEDIYNSRNRQGIYRLYTNPGNQLVVDAHDENWNEITPDWDEQYERLGVTMTTREIAEYAMDHGYDSVRINNVYDHGGLSSSYKYGYEAGYGDIGIFFNPDAVKSADTVTYDESGNVIPLSERFNDQNNDIRYSLPSDNVLRDQMNEYLANGGSLAERQTPPEGTTLPGAPGMGPQRQFGSRTAQESDALHQEVKDYLYSHSTYTPDSNQAQIDRAIGWVQNHANDQDQEGYFGAVADVESPDFDYRSADGQARMLTLMGMAALKGDVATELRLADAYNRQGTDLGQQLQARKLFRMMTPLGRRTILQQQVSRINQQYADQGQSRRVELPEFILIAAEKANTADDFDRVRKAAAKTLASQMPVNWKDKLTAWRMLSMLGNPRTHVRNILGNFIFMPAVGLKNKIGAGIETVFLKEGERSKTLGFANSEARAFAKEDAKAVKNILTGEAKYREGDQVQRERKPFKSKILQGLSDFNGWALEAEDWVFLERHYRNALAGYMTANKLTEADMNGETLQTARTYAIQEAQKATYRDANAVASWLNEAQRKHPGIGFAVNAVLPFKKTPANILKRGVEYSPVGLINALTRGSKQLLMYQNAVKNGLPIPEKAISPAQYIDKISAGLSGTAITALGAMLSAMGVATAGLNDDDDELKKLQGQQEYSLNLNLFGQDVSYTVDWAAPVCMPFFVGATIMDIYKDQHKGEDFDIGEVLDSILGITEPVFNLSMLDGVNSLLETAQYGEGNAITQIGEKVLTNYLTSFVPTFAGQVARTIDPTRRKSFVESGASLSTFRYALEGLENKIPYLSRTNIPYRDVWGNSETNGSWAENFFSPGYSNEIKNDPVVAELDRIYQETGIKSVIPKAAGKTVSGEKLSAERYDQYAVDRGQMAYQTIQSLMESPLWQTCDDETRASMIGDAWTYANALAKYNLQGGKVDSWIMNASANGSVVKDIYNRAADKNKANYISGYGQALAEAINNDDEEAMGVAMQALEDAGATETQIKGAIRDYFKPLYQRAFMNGDEDTMEDIEEKVVDATSDFAKKQRLTSEIVSTWVPGADEEEDEEETGDTYSWLNLQND